MATFAALSRGAFAGHTAAEIAALADRVIAPTPTP